MGHIGNLLKKAISAGGFSQAEVAERVGKGRNTVQRWLATPNLGLKEVRDVQQAIPELYLKSVYDALEETLQHEIPDNPYRKSAATKPATKETSGTGISVMIDAEIHAGYWIPSDFVLRVKRMLDEAQNEAPKK